MVLLSDCWRVEMISLHHHRAGPEKRKQNQPKSVKYTCPSCSRALQQIEPVCYATTNEGEFYSASSSLLQLNSLADVISLNFWLQNGSHTLLINSGKAIKGKYSCRKDSETQRTDSEDNTALKHRVRLLVVSIGGGQDLCEVRHLWKPPPWQIIDVSSSV